jgi:uncharacterized membrane protein required for colicin V production
MKIFLDLSVAALIVATIVICRHRGFVRSVLGATKTLVAVILTFMFGSLVSDWLCNAWIGARVTDFVHGRFLSMFEDGARVFNPSRIVSELPSWLRTLFDATTADSASTGADYAHMTEATADELYEMAEAFAAPIARVISDFIGYAAVFLVSMLLLSVAAFLLGKIADLPLIRSVDRLLGLALGIFGAFFYAAAYTLLMFGLLSLVEGSFEELQFHRAFEESLLFRWFYEHNLLRWIFGIG